MYLLWDRYNNTPLFGQKYCKKCLSLYINDITDINTYLDITVNLECSEFEMSKNKKLIHIIIIFKIGVQRFYILNKYIAVVQLILKNIVNYVENLFVYIKVNLISHFISKISNSRITNN